MKQNKTSFTAMALTLILLALVGASGWNTHKAFDAKVEQQDRILSNFRQWKAAYMALMPIKDEWDAKFPKAADVKDIYSIYSLLNRFVSTNPDDLRIDKMERPSYGEDKKEIGLTKVCVYSMSQPGTLVTGASAGDIMDSLSRLAAQPYVTMGSVKLSREQKGVQAVIQNLCVLLRD